MKQEYRKCDGCINTSLKLICSDCVDKKTKLQFEELKKWAKEQEESIKLVGKVLKEKELALNKEWNTALEKTIENIDERFWNGRMFKPKEIIHVINIIEGLKKK